MSEHKINPPPEFKSIEEQTEFFDTHDMGDYVKHLPEAHFDVDLKVKRFLLLLPSNNLETV